MRPNEKREKPLVVIDARMVGPVGHGISEYVRDLILGLRELSPKEYDVHILTGRSLPKEDLLRKDSHTDMRAPFLSSWENIEVYAALQKLGADLFHSPSFSAFPFLGVPTIYTVHDLIHLEFGNLFHKAYYQLVLKPALKRSRCVCTVSEFSQNEIAKWLGWPTEKVQTVPNSISTEELLPAWEELINQRGLNPGQYHLCVSNHKPHKNMRLLIQAYLSHVEKNKNAWPLVVTLASHELELNHPKVHFLGQIKPDEKNSLLAGAGAFYFPSLSEGFGRPPLEAATYHIPLAVSDIPAHREIMRNFQGVKFIGPHDQNSWEQAFGAAEVGRLPKAEGKWDWSRTQLSSAYHRLYLKNLILS